MTLFRAWILARRFSVVSYYFCRLCRLTQSKSTVCHTSAKERPSFADRWFLCIYSILFAGTTGLNSRSRRQSVAAACFGLGIFMQSGEYAYSLVRYPQASRDGIYWNPTYPAI